MTQEASGIQNQIIKIWTKLQAVWIIWTVEALSILDNHESPQTKTSLWEGQEVAQTSLCYKRILASM